MKSTLVLVLCLLLLACGQTRALPEGPAPLLDDSGLHEIGFGDLSFVARDGSALKAWTYRATGFEPEDGVIWFVMHGASRDVERYIRAAAPVAERHDALTVAIHFDKGHYPKNEDYTLGVKAADWIGHEKWRAPEDYSYSEVEHLFDAMVERLGGVQAGYYLFGHSAGAQFTHRLLTFLPEARVLRAVAANAGWYTLPTSDDPRFNSMPYGILGAPVEDEDMHRLFARELVVLLGEADTERGRLLRDSPEAEAQGAHRLARGQHYFDVAQSEAAEAGVPFRWRLATVPRAAHDAGAMLDSAGYFLFEEHPAPCRPTAAPTGAGIRITEILADPPDDRNGDANGDGRRDPSEDEFVEFVNNGAEPLCLTGWTLGDAENPMRHVFPIGDALGPGERLVVFGGGVPTGDFHGAAVQSAEHGLSLSNRGDVLTLRDTEDRIVRQISWGDCDGRPCADDHWTGELGIESSLVRTDANSRWVPRVQRDGRPYAPGEALANSERSEHP